MQATEPTSKSNLKSSIWRQHCRGVLPLEARLEPWMTDLFDGQTLADLVAQHGSPLNLISPTSMRANLDEVTQVAEDRGVDFQAFFARKSNKCLAFVDEAIRCDAGLDTASENEIQQCLDRGVTPDRIICTAAVKQEALLRLCLNHSICIAIDNQDELDVIASLAQQTGLTAVLALRIGGFHHRGSKLPTRFGFDVDRDLELLDELVDLPVRVAGIHFHLDGYDASQRVTGLAEALGWIEHLRDQGHAPTFIDMGGGFPISYLDHEHQWNDFWREHESSLLGQRSPITYRNHPLGRQVLADSVTGKPNVYPYFQSPTRAAWLASILDTEINGCSVAKRINDAKVQLRCEPGRSLMDGCGMTVARVEYRKQNSDGDWLIGLSMNRTQCRTTTDDFLVDPIVLPIGEGESSPMTGYLVGAYCTESELLSLRQMEFPTGVRRGDLVVFPNTAGYLMHFLESRSHQFPLAKNLVVADGPEGTFELDRIDMPSLS
ncbi:diaminopimelate decarboxylase [Neorhodopirellula lusitana]|uniref:Diaminopimelate decarboxylase n=2 Tax=Neorhodopirellula lusitana TaxID=445327 RepID=A0ABY1QC64_9BACT|nr:diaminopimelate decarboxylase [Neorhodopirellula lusitana]